jgi:hypothetical protein
MRLVNGGTFCNSVNFCMQVNLFPVIALSCQPGLVRMGLDVGILTDAEDSASLVVDNGREVLARIVRFGHGTGLVILFFG